MAGPAKTIFRYMGLDKIERRTEVQFDPAPQHMARNQALYALALAPGEQISIVMTARCAGGAVCDYSVPYRAARRQAQQASTLGGKVTSSNALANRMLHRAGADLNMLVTATPQGPYPYAGTPWFSTRSGATASSPRWRCCGSIPRLRRAC